MFKEAPTLDKDNFDRKPQGPMQ